MNRADKVEKEQGGGVKVSRGRLSRWGRDMGGQRKEAGAGAESWQPDRRRTHGTDALKDRWTQSWSDPTH